MTERKELSRVELEYLIIRRPVELVMERYQQGAGEFDTQVAIEGARKRLLNFFCEIASILSNREKKDILDIVFSRPLYDDLERKIDEIMAAHPEKVTPEEWEARRFVKAAREAMAGDNNE